MDLIKKALIINSSTPGICGAKRDRTADLLNAIQALSQLSYSPTFPLSKCLDGKRCLDTMFGKKVSSFFWYINGYQAHISCQAQETLLDYDVFHGLMLFSMLGPYFLYRRYGTK